MTRNIPAAPLAQNLKRALTEANMTQEALARDAGVSLRIVQRWCSGEGLPRWAQLVRIACVLHREPGWFYAEHEPNGEAAA